MHLLTPPFIISVPCSEFYATRRRILARPRSFHLRVIVWIDLLSLDLTPVCCLVCGVQRAPPHQGPHNLACVTSYLSNTLPVLNSGFYVTRERILARPHSFYLYAIAWIKTVPSSCLMCRVLCTR